MLELAILFLAAFAAAAISGAAGFGGALLLLPRLTATVGVTAAVPLLTIAQLIGNLSRAGFGFRHIRRRSVGRFLLGAAPFSFPGAQSFVSLPGALMTRVIGAAILAFVALRVCGVLKLKASRARLVLGGAVVGFLLGLAGRAGPLGSAVFSRSACRRWPISPARRRPRWRCMPSKPWSISVTSCWIDAFGGWPRLTGTAMALGTLAA
jgi:hypothetical protein